MNNRLKKELNRLYRKWKVLTQDWKNRQELRKKWKIGYEHWVRKKFGFRIKDEFLFISGLLIGILTGVIGNFFVDIYFRWVDEKYSFNDFLVILIAFIIVLLLFIIWLLTISLRLRKMYWEDLDNKGIDD
jgi:phosphotransferase system  glucose/maltose/N-acetylglucosamine-specific IIC component